jgi:non-canonical (house-cleaning) NTP pyrophosphatase
MEGILTKSNYGTFLCGWSVIFDKKDNDYLYGCSAKVRVPDDVIKKTTKDIRLSDVVAEYVGMTGDVVSNLGTNGILTNGEYTRTDEFIDSVNCAMSSKFKKI